MIVLTVLLASMLLRQEWPHVPFVQEDATPQKYVNIRVISAQKESICQIMVEISISTMRNQTVSTAQ